MLPRRGVRAVRRDSATLGCRLAVLLGAALGAVLIAGCGAAAGTAGTAGDAGDAGSGRERRDGAVDVGRDAAAGDRGDGGVGKDAAPDRGRCAPGEFLGCAGYFAMVCDDAGEGFIATNCPFGCNAEARRCDECVRGTTACQHNDLVVCDSEGVVLSRAVCQYGCDDSAGPAACRTCEGGPTCPAEMALIAELGVCIDRYEASHGPGGEARSAGGGAPWVLVSLYEARDACGLAGKRLCSEEEWLAACQGPAHTAFPYGEVYQPGACNDWALGGTGILPAGSLPGCEGGYPGIYDLLGNVKEWTTACEVVGSCALRGGYWQEYGRRCSYVSAIVWGGEGREEQLGFRCCSDGPPDWLRPPAQPYARDSGRRDERSAAADGRAP